MLTNWPTPQTRITLSRERLFEGVTFPEGSEGVLIRTITEKKDFESENDEFVIKIDEEELTVTRADITLVSRG